MYGYGYQYGTTLLGGSLSTAIFSAYKTRVLADGGVVENDACTIAFLESIGAGIIPLFDADYQAVLTYATAQGYTLPSSGQQTLQNDLVVALKDGGIWDDCDVIRIAANDSGLNFSTINWKTPNTYQATLINSPTFVTNSGIQGNGTSSYINENFAPANGINLQLNDASQFVWVNSAISVGGFLCGVNDAAGANGLSFERDSSSTIYPRINASSSLLYTNAINNAPGLFGNHRSSATSTSFSKDGVVKVTTSKNSTNRTANNSYSLCRNNNGSAINLMNYIYSANFFSKNITGTKLTDLYNALNTYLTSI
jgi:hypothetical protein